MNWGILFVGGLAVVALVLFFMVQLSPTPPGDVVPLVPGSIPGSEEQVITAVLPRSKNQPEGAVYSLDGWVLVNDFTTGFGERRPILNRENSPGVFLDSTSNSLIFSVKTYGGVETILVENIPAKKWIHFAIVVDQQAVHVYINGKLRQHHTLGQLPDLSDGPVVFGKGWDGVVGKVTFYARSLTNMEVDKLSKQEPPDDLQRKPQAGGYFDLSWYMGRL
jgi:hypothetical protein